MDSNYEGMLKKINSILFNKELAKDKDTLIKFAKYLKDTNLNPNDVLLYTDNRLLLGIYLHFLEVEYNIGIHADRTCYIIFYINEDKIINRVIPFYKKGGFTPYIYEWYAQTRKEITSANENYANAILYVINKLTNPF